MKIKLKNGDIELPESKDKAAIMLADMFRNRGRVSSTDQVVEWKDFYVNNLSTKDQINTSDIRPFLEQTTEIMFREPVDPIMNITGLFTRLQVKGLTHQIIGGALGGAFYAEDISEGQPVPEYNFTIGGGLQTAWIGKTGIGASFSDEALRYSTWDIMGMHLRMMRGALMRLKEQKAIRHLRSIGTVLFDNAAPTRSLYGVTTGRGLDMAANGTFCADDLFQVVAHGSQTGFPYDTMVVSPLMFLKFCQDPVMRDMFISSAGSSGAWVSNWAGEAGPRDPWSNGSIGARGPTMGYNVVPHGAASGEAATKPEERSNQMTARFVIPNYFGWSMNVVVSPLLPFDEVENVGDIIFIASGQVGYLLEEEGMKMTEWRNETNETMKIKMIERYGFNIINEGLGVGLVKNVKIERQYWNGTFEVHSTTLPSAINPTTPIV